MLQRSAICSNVHVLVNVTLLLPLFSPDSNILPRKKRVWLPRKRRISLKSPQLDSHPVPQRAAHRKHVCGQDRLRRQTRKVLERTVYYSGLPGAPKPAESQDFWWHLQENLSVLKAALNIPGLSGDLWSTLHPILPNLCSVLQDFKKCQRALQHSALTWHLMTGRKWNMTALNKFHIHL